MRNRPGLPSASNGKEAHKGYFDRTGNVHLLDTKIADKIIDQKCGGCLVAYYNMGIGRLLRYEKEFLTTASTQLSQVVSDRTKTTDKGES